MHVCSQRWLAAAHTAQPRVRLCTFEVQVSLLAEPTNLLASLGTALVFCSAILVVYSASMATTTNKDGSLKGSAGGPPQLSQHLLPSVGRPADGEQGDQSVTIDDGCRRAPC